MLAILLPKLWFGLKIMTGTTVFCMSSWGSPLKDLLVDVAIWLLAAMMIMVYYWRFWEPWANAMLAILLPKLWFGLKIMTGTTVFACLPGLTLTGPKKASKRTVLHNRLNKGKNSRSMLPIWLLAAMMIMMYYWRFWEPWANAMLAILLPKLWFGLKIMTGTTVFACLPGAHPYWTQKSFKTNSFYIID